MPQLLEYIIKLSGTLIIFYLFYWLVLSRLTFYTANRWYLLGYSIAAFFIPLINVSPILEQEQIINHGIVRWVPVVAASGLETTGLGHVNAFQWNVWTVTFLILCTGSLLMLIRFIVQYSSVVSLRRASRLISDGDVKVYQVHKNIVPFSFGNSIFINQDKHTEAELQDIIRHEFIHVKQKHTLDIVVSECLCIVNWFNPFAWLIRNAVRQNLEFIADSKVIQNGVDKKQYQYLLLKVIGVPHYSIATNFNFTSLKKRITMMNKMQSARVHFIKFLFLVPLMAVILLAFRNRASLQVTESRGYVDAPALHGAEQSGKTLSDTTPSPSRAPQPVSASKSNTKGYVITIADNHGECIVIVKNKQNKIVKAVSLTEWDENKKEYNAQYGEIPPVPAELRKNEKLTEVRIVPLSDTQSREAPDNIASVQVINNIVTLTLKDGDTETYDLTNPQHKAVFERRYGRANPNVRIIIDSLRIPNEKSVQENGTPAAISGFKPETVRLKNPAWADFLLVLDGKEYTNRTEEIVSKLDPNSIETIDVIKDETAKKLYGDKAKNGVIKITTRAKSN